ISEDDRSHSVNFKILGVPWNASTDALVVKSQLPHFELLTKRNILRAVHSTFDPLGLLVPLLLRARIFLQNLWLKKYEWDQPIAESDVEQWNNIVKNTENFEKVIPRKLGMPQGQGTYEICTFADASTNAYATCTYIRHVSGSVVEIYLLCAKYRLAPVSQLTSTKTGTIPKLELLALLIAAQLTDFVRKELDLPISKIRIFSDSKIALHQVHSGKNAGTFVNNRVKKIRALHTTWENANIESSFYHVNSTENPADCATRGIDRENFHTHFWWHGPQFLLKNENLWSQTEPFQMVYNDTEVTMQNCMKNAHESSSIFRYSLSNFNKLKRSAAFVLKFVKKIGKNRYRKDSQAEQGFTRLATDNGVYRCQGRLSNAHLGFDATNPILLVPNHILTNIIVMHAHKKCGHQGVGGTLAELQTNYRLISNRSEALQLLDETKESLAKFWQLWSNTYLTTLQNFHLQECRKKSRKLEPVVGSVVLLQDQSSPRSQWKMGIIQKLHPGEDAQVRTVSVRCPSGKVIKRPINMLIPLELSVTEDESEMDVREERMNSSSQSENCGIRKQPDRKVKKKVSYAEYTNIVPYNAPHKSLNRLDYSTLLNLVMILAICGTVSSKHASDTNITNLKAKCIKGGVFLDALSPFTEVQVCTDRHCVQATVLENEISIMFPAEVCLHEHNVLIKA
ncbi:Pao retrotransposon peptidase, partial [Ostertagia ostertagi]